MCLHDRDCSHGPLRPAKYSFTTLVLLLDQPPELAERLATCRWPGHVPKVAPRMDLGGA